MTEAGITVRRGEVIVRKHQSPYDQFVRDFIATMDVQGVLISGYPAILLGRSRQTEDIDMFVPRMDENSFIQWWGRLHDAGFWCINAGRDDAWALFQDHLAPRFARQGTVDPNMEIKMPRGTIAEAALERAWRLELLDVKTGIGDLSDQIAYKFYLGTADGEDEPQLRMNKDLEDALHLALVLGDVVDWAQVERMVSILEGPQHLWREFRARIESP